MEKTIDQMVRARNDVFYSILYKDMTHDELVSLFEKEFGITAWQMDRTLVMDGKSSEEEMILANEARRKQVRENKKTVTKG